MGGHPKIMSIWMGSGSDTHIITRMRKLKLRLGHAKVMSISF
jgi:hypothetical protein